MLTGVDESVCCVNSVMSPGVLDLCGVDTVVSGVDEPVCGVSSVMTASELDVCGCDSIVSDEAGNSSGVEMIVPIYYAFLVGGWLSVAGDTSMGGAGVARSDRGDNGWWFVPGVVQPSWVDGLTCADGFLRPEPPLMHAMSLQRMLLAAAC